MEKGRGRVRGRKEKREGRKKNKISNKTRYLLFIQKKKKE
jgi:hypothetical protein